MRTVERVERPHEEHHAVSPHDAAARAELAQALLQRVRRAAPPAGERPARQTRAALVPAPATRASGGALLSGRTERARGGQRRARDRTGARCGAADWAEGSALVSGHGILEVLRPCPLVPENLNRHCREEQDDSLCGARGRTALRLVCSIDCSLPMPLMPLMHS